MTESEIRLKENDVIGFGAPTDLQKDFLERNKNVFVYRLRKNAKRESSVIQVFDRRCFN